MINLKVKVLIVLLKKKSDILSFYIKNNTEPKILCTDEIKELYSLYNDINFKNINKDYIEVNEGEIDVVHYEPEEIND